MAKHCSLWLGRPSTKTKIYTSFIFFLHLIFRPSSNNILLKTMLSNLKTCCRKSEQQHSRVHSTYNLGRIHREIKRCHLHTALLFSNIFATRTLWQVHSSFTNCSQLQTVRIIHTSYKYRKQSRGDRQPHVALLMDVPLPKKFYRPEKSLKKLLSCVY